MKHGLKMNRRNVHNQLFFEAKISIIHPFLACLKFAVLYQKKYISVFGPNKQDIMKKDRFCSNECLYQFSFKSTKICVGNEDKEATAMLDM